MNVLGPVHMGLSDLQELSKSFPADFPYGLVCLVTKMSGNIRMNNMFSNRQITSNLYIYPQNL